MVRVLQACVDACGPAEISGDGVDINCDRVVDDCELEGCTDQVDNDDRRWHPECTTTREPIEDTVIEARAHARWRASS